MIFPQFVPVSFGHDLANTRGTLASAGNPAGSFGSLVELASATDYDAQGFFLWLRAATSVRYQIKLYAGAAGSEVEFAHLGGALATGAGSSVVYVPIAIPAGTRIAFAVASSSTFSQAYAHISLVRGSSSAPLVSRGTLCGIASNDWSEVDCGTTANTKGAYKEIIASTVRPAKGYTLFFHGDPSTTISNFFLFDVAVGAAGSEQIILANAHVAAKDFGPPVSPNVIGPIWTPIPAGSRLAVRGQCSSAGASDTKPLALITLWE